MSDQPTSPKASEAFETKLTPHPVCPHCGRMERDAWEWNFGPGLDGSYTGECNSCGEEFTTERQVSVYYSTTIPARAADAAIR